MTTDQNQTPWWDKLTSLVSKYGASQVFADFVYIGACSLCHPTREDEYVRVAGKYTPEEVNVFAHVFGEMLFERARFPYKDALGEAYIALVGHADKQTLNTLYTPEHVAEMMAMLSFTDELYKSNKNPDEPILVIDPACGSGAMLLQAAKILNNMDKLPQLVVQAASSDYLSTQVALVNLNLARIRAEVKHVHSETQETLGVWHTNTKLVNAMLQPFVELVSDIENQKEQNHA